MFEVYHDLGCRRFKNTDHAIQAWYNELGEKRFKEGIPLAEVLWALVLTKDHLREYIRTFMFADSALELYRKLELTRLIEQFFDRAVCYAAEGYEREACPDREDGAATIARCGTQALT